MSDSTTLIDTISSGQIQPEVTANQYFDAASPATLFGRRGSATSLLTWAYYGGTLLVDGVLTGIANGTVTLSASATNYVEATRAGVVSKNTTGFTAGSIPLYVVTTNTTTASSYTDERAWVDPHYLSHKASVSITTADVTLTAEQARARHILLSGTLTGNRSLIVPNSGEWVVYNNTAGAYTVTVKTLAGTGDTVDQSSNLVFFADGTNVVAFTTGGSVAMDDLTDVNTAGVADGDVLAYDSGTSTWLPVASAAVPTQAIPIACSDETTALTTGTAKVTFRMPYAFTLTGVRASVTTAPTDATLTVDINEGGVSILSTKLTIDATEKTSTTAATAAVISDSSLADDAEITIDIDQVGSTIAGAGLKVYLIGTKT
jgi:hypothetical protein